MPDTQFLYWGSQGSINPEPQEASFRYIIDNSGDASEDNIVFMAHLGDLTEDAAASSFQYVDKAFDILDSRGVAYSVLAGNHDVSGDDTARHHAVPADDGAAAVQRSRRRSPAPTPPATTPRTSSARPAGSGCCSRWTGGPPRRASPGRTSSSSQPDAAGHPHHARDRRPDLRRQRVPVPVGRRRRTTPRSPATARRSGTA